MQVGIIVPSAEPLLAENALLKLSTKVDSYSSAGINEENYL